MRVQNCVSVHLDATSPHLSGKPGQEVPHVLPTLKHDALGDAAVDDVMPGVGRIESGSAGHT